MAITENQKRWAAKHRQNVRDYIKTAKGDICSDCKEKFPHYNLEFDHARGIYKFRIADAGARSLKSIKEDRFYSRPGYVFTPDWDELELTKREKRWL